MRTPSVAHIAMLGTLVINRGASTFTRWRPYNKHILCIDPPQEAAETTPNSNQVGTTGKGPTEGLFISSMAIVDGLSDSNQDDWFLDSCSNITITNN